MRLPRLVHNPGLEVRKGPKWKFSGKRGLLNGMQFLVKDMDDWIDADHDAGGG
jgi:hypothetical protein